MKKETIETGAALLRAGIADPAERSEALTWWARAGKQNERRDKMISAKEAAELAGVHKKTIQEWERKGFLHGRHITAKRVRFSRNELEAFLCETAAEG